MVPTEITREMQKTIMENSGTTGNNTTNNGKPDQESKYESDLNKSTARVNSTTGLKDGVYTPDSFSWSGGTGKVSITCSKVTVTGGQAYATITFSSPHYQYVKRMEMYIIRVRKQEVLHPL